MTQRSVLTTQSKLAVQAPVSGEWGARQKRHPWRFGGSAHPCALPRVLGRFRGVCYSAYVKTSRSCDTASRGKERGRRSGA